MLKKYGNVRVLLSLLLVFGIAGAALFSANSRSSSGHEKLPTYFVYTDEELQTVSDQKSVVRITSEDIFELSEEIEGIVSASRAPDYMISKLLAYVTIAQRDFAYLSFNQTGNFTGSLEIITNQVMCQFAEFKNGCTEQDEAVEDEYSEELATVVMTKVKQRIQQDSAQTKKYPIPTSPSLWKGVEPYDGQDVGSWKPWYMESGSEFRAAPPPQPNSAEYKKLLLEVKSARQNITEDQRVAVAHWSGVSGTKTLPGLWMEMASEELAEHDMDIKDILLVRSKLQAGIADSLIAVYDSKYTYLQKRPSMADPSIITVMPMSNSPSYPSGQGSVANVAATILSHYLPDERETFEGYVQETNDSRLWGGLHYSIDNEAGQTMGTKVGKKVIDTTK